MFLCPHSLAVRTPPCHGGGPGSIPGAGVNPNPGLPEVIPEQFAFEKQIKNIDYFSNANCE